MVIDEALELISINSDLTYLQGECSDGLIIEAERKLNNVFPQDYRRFIQRFGAGSVGDLEIFGIIPSNPDASAVPNTVWINLKRRERNSYPEDKIIVAQSPDGYVYHISTSEDTIECPVYLSPPHDLSIMEKESDRFADFLGTLITDALNNVDEE